MAEIYCNSCKKKVNDKYFTEKQVEELPLDVLENYECEQCYYETGNPYENQPDSGAMIDNDGCWHY